MKTKTVCWCSVNSQQTMLMKGQGGGNQVRSCHALCTLKKTYTISSEVEERFAPASSFSLKNRITIIFLQVL